MTRWTLALTLAAALSPLTGMAEPTADSEAKKLLARFENEPSVNDVQQAALTYAAMHPEETENAKARSRWAAALPEVRFRVTKNADDEQKQLQRYNGPGTPTEPLSDTSTNDQKMEYQGEVRWKLNELAFSKWETKLVSENRQVAKQRQSILQSVTQVYFERRRAQVDLMLSPPGDAAARTLAELKIAELTAELDGMTGGAFSRMVAEH